MRTPARSRRRCSQWSALPQRHFCEQRFGTRVSRSRRLGCVKSSLQALRTSCGSSYCARWAMRSARVTTNRSLDNWMFAGRRWPAWPESRRRRRTAPRPRSPARARRARPRRRRRARPRQPRRRRRRGRGACARTRTRWSCAARATPSWSASAAAAPPRCSRCGAGPVNCLQLLLSVRGAARRAGGHARVRARSPGAGCSFRLCMGHTRCSICPVP